MPLYIAVWDDAAEVALGNPTQEMVVAIGGTSTASLAVSGPVNRHKRMRVFATANCFVTWGSSPVATNDGLTGRPLGSENPEYFDIITGQAVAVIERV
jgi:hypothetical protein